MRNRMKRGAVAGGVLLWVGLFRSCCDAVFVAPLGTNTVIVEYDHVCRPSVYQKTWFGKKEIWTYPRGGFMETVSFGVEWLSQFKLTYDDVRDEYDEEYIIDVP